jgi:N-acetylmuramoyl-L-alanine amidase
MKIITPRIVILHCAATPDFIEADLCFDKFNVYDVDRWHRERGFQSCGYHWVVTRRGEIQAGRKCEADRVHEGAHCEGQNHHSIGICYIGMTTPTRYQIKSLQILLTLLNNMFNLTADKWYPHNHFNVNKSCPGFGLEAMKAMLIKEEK